MSKKTVFCIVDTETTQRGQVADFAAVLCDKKGAIINQCAVLTRGIYDDRKNNPLFFSSLEPVDSIWSNAGKDRRYANYDRMLDTGIRTLASVAAINRWLDKAAATYNPILTAYNLPFDLDKCNNTGIDLSMFPQRFCLWAAAFSAFHSSRKFRQFILENHYFNPPTSFGNMTYKTNAEVMARFIMENNQLPAEPHTALEDIIGYELPILTKIVGKHGKKNAWLNPVPYNWKAVQVRDWFKVK